MMWRRWSVYLVLSSLLVLAVCLSFAEGAGRIPSQVTSLSLSKTVLSRLPALQATWTTPQSDEPIFKYILQYRINGTTSWGSKHIISGSPPQNSIIVPRLAVGTEYDVRVRAVSAEGMGKWSAVQTERTYMKPPSPNHHTVSAVPVERRGVIRVSWTAPTLPRGELPIIGYIIRYKVQNSNVLKHWPAMSNSETEVTGLNPGTVYRVYVAGFSAIGPGQYCCEGTAVHVTTYNVPSQVTGVDVSKATRLGQPALSVTWTTPKSELTISKYQVQYRRSGTNWRAVNLVSPGSTTSTLLEDLDAGTVYKVRIRAVSAIGNGRWSRVESETTYMITPLPNVSLANSTLQSLSISWSVTSPQDVTNYMVFWWKESAEISKSVALNNTKFVIEGLLSNTAYHVVVLASGPLGNVNSTSEVFYTTPKEVQGSLVRVLPEQILKVAWKPSENAGRSAIEYIVNTTTTGMDYINSTSVMHPVTSIPISGLPQYSSGTVSVWAKNPGAISKPVILRFRMVNIVTNVTGVAANWVDDSFTSLRVTVPEGGVYRISYWAVNKSNTTEQEVVTTGSSSQVVKGFSPQYFYTIVVEAVFMETGKGIVGIGVGITVAVAAAVIFLLLGLCCCWLARRRRHKKNATFLHFNQPWPWTLNRFTENNEPVALTDVVDHSAGGKDQDHLHVQPTPVDGNADALVSEPGSISKQLFPAHVREMHHSRDEGFEREFGNVSDDPNGSDIIAKQSQNKSRNRYLNTNTYDHSRVILKVPDENGSDYINASYIEGYGRSGHYIAAQGPKVEEVSIFWQMVMEHKPAVVVMLTNVEENGKRKCEQYWKNDLDNPFNAGKDINVVTTRYRGFADYDVRDLTVKNPTHRPHKLTHFQYTAWPDHGVPLHTSSLVKFVQEVRKVHDNSPAPMVVHCSAGVGRTGTFITLDAMMERLKQRDDLNIFEFVNEMRTRRKQMVQTVEQYVLIHDALNDYITCGDTSVVAYQLRMAIHDLDKEEDGQSGFKRQFEFLAKASRMPVRDDEIFAKNSLVAKKNRYKDKCPYSTNYLHIAGQSASNAANYINATMIASYSKRRGYVAAQAPLESTRTDVWEPIWQFKIKNIVLLCPLKEKKTLSCCKFWPDESVRSVKYGHLTISHIDTTSHPDWKMTTMQVVHNSKSSESPFEVTLFHFLSWPRKGRPPTDSMLKMIGQVEKKQKDIKAPLMVMCDDGMSRSGVFITCMTEIERVKVEGGVDIFQTVKAARAQRPHMVYDSDQYKLCFETLQSHLDSFDTYANFKAV